MQVRLVELHVWRLVHKWTIQLTKKQSCNILGIVAAMLILANSNILLCIHWPKYHCETSLKPQNQQSQTLMKKGAADVSPLRELSPLPRCSHTWLDKEIIQVCITCQGSPLRNKGHYVFSNCIQYSCKVAEIWSGSKKENQPTNLPSLLFGITDIV